MVSKETIESLLNNHDLTDFKWIDPKEIVVAQWVRVKCTFGCGDYGLGACPPNTPTVEECERFFKEYESAVLIRLTRFADKDAYPAEWSRDMTKRLLDIERSIFLSGFQKAFLLNQSCCSICKDCPGNRVDCLDKTRSRPSAESFAVDVYSTARSAGLEINVIPDSPALINKFAILLIE
jgi:predicted metal-binding protein